MCSIGEDDFGDEGGAHAMIKDNEMDTSCEVDQVEKIVCKKCNQNLAAVKIQFRDAECQNCFLMNVRHKFRATLGSSKLIPKDSEILILFDGSNASIVLADMLHYAQTQNNFKKLHCSTKLLYIDEDFGHNLDLKEIENFLRKYNFESYIVSLGGNGDPVNFKEILNYIQNPQRKSEEENFQTEFGNIKTLTSQQDYLERRRKVILKKAADFLDIKFIFLPDTTSDLAVTLLTDVSLGRGASMADDVSLCDNRYENVKFVRPIKDLLPQEIECYLKFCNLNHTELSEHIPYGSNLESDAISTIFRVGEKIAVNKKNQDVNLESTLEKLNISSTKCMFCNANLDFFDSNTLLAIEFSRLASENTDSENLDNLDSLEKRAWESLYGESTNDKILKNLCHGCRNLYRDCGNYLYM
ncbi:cytoplasmic tRNA 2-thiolation protein 2 [Condylostylus longicornis]|uniref:cytoplasmic tRNA 2-thiolation protein 2 n=1 Tax=Condylostylus longicornis TaxID=2530218 RepID=UPI00244E49D9|nr:cytoplasmic tRNA 2-thiolation protein 2 [Condylostylus longicornis]